MGHTPMRSPPTVKAAEQPAAKPAKPDEPKKPSPVKTAP